MIRSATPSALRKSLPSCSTPAGCWSFPSPIACCRCYAGPAWPLTWPRWRGLTTARWRSRTLRPPRRSRPPGGATTCLVTSPPAASDRTAPNCSPPRWPRGSGGTAGHTSASARWTACGRWPPSACQWAWSRTPTAAWRATCAASASATSRTPPTGQVPRRPEYRWASSSTPPWSAWPSPTPRSSASRWTSWACLRAAPSCTSGTACATTWPAPSRRACSRSTWTRTGAARRPTATRTSAASPS